MICQQCGALNDAVMNMTGETGPEEGDVLICFCCGHLAVFTGHDLDVRPPTGIELPKLMAEPEIREMIEKVILFNLSQAENLTLVPCGCRFGTRNGVFFMEAHSKSCDVAAYAVEQSRKMGKPVEQIDTRP